MNKDHPANKEYRYGCSIDCGGTPLRVYERTLNSTNPWTSLEDYMQAGGSLWYGSHQQVGHSQGKTVTMNANADPIGQELTDSNGMPVSAAIEPCLCVAFSSGVCVPSLEGCASPCGEMPKVLSSKKSPSQKDPEIPWILPFPGIGGLSWIVGKGVMEDCERKYGKSSNCDKLGHCVAACLTSSWGGRLSSWCGGWLNEIIFYPWQGLDQHDLKANYVGELCAKAYDASSCLSCCTAWWKHAWLD